MTITIDSRALGAIRFVDAVSGAAIQEPLQVATRGATLQRNLSGLVVIVGVLGLESHAQTFASPPATPAIGSVVVSFTVADPRGRYVARGFRVALPRDPDPAHRASAASLFRPIDVAMFRSPAATPDAGWAVIRVQVMDQANGAGLGGALLLVSRPGDGVIIGRGLADARGEALVGVRGIPATTWGVDTGPVLATEIDAVLEAVFDPTAGAPPDPDDVEANAKTLPAATSLLKLAARREQRAALALVVPVA